MSEKKFSPAELRFLFLAGVFQMHPDLYLRLKLIAKPTRDAVVSYFGG